MTYLVEQTDGGFQIIDRHPEPFLNVPDRVVTTIINVPDDDVASAFYLANTLCDVLNDELPRVRRQILDYVEHNW